jgi:hypothetical protein
VANCNRFGRFTWPIVGRDSSVGIATGYGPGFESRWGRDFRTRPDWPWGPPSPCIMGTGSFPVVKRTGRGADHPPLSSAEVKKE